MDKIIIFLKTPNRYKHLFVGFLIGICALGAWTAIYTTVIAASCLKLKDWLRGCRWNWTDWVFTVIGGSMASFILFAL